MLLIQRKISVALLASALGACGGGSTISSAPGQSATEPEEAAAATTPEVELQVVQPAPAAPQSLVEEVPQNDAGSSQEVVQPPEPEPAPPRNYTSADITELLLVTGQSNALGLLTAYDAVLDDPHKRVFAFTNEGWQRADLHQVWDQDWFPRGNQAEAPSNNFAFHMAKEVTRRHDHRVVGFILATAPGESIDHWNQDDEFFRHIDAKVLDAINQIPHKSKLDGILWHQGESDEGDQQYHEKLDRLISTFRQQNWFASDRPFICGETAEFEVVNQQLMALNNNGDQWTGCVNSNGLSTHADGYHFDAAGLRELGKRYATKYLSMIR